jgi:hypothetical protein
MDVLPALQGYPFDPTVRRRTATAAPRATRRRRPGTWRRLAGRLTGRSDGGAVVEGPFGDGPFGDGPIAHRATK